jgi:hypothetical protein
MVQYDFEAWAVYKLPIDLHNLLQSMASDTGQSIPDILRKSVNVFDCCLKARRQGKMVAVVGPDGDIEQEFVGFESELSEKVHSLSE